VRFVLASASPARLRTLRSAGIEPEVIVSGVDEDSILAPSPAELVQALARAKATTVAAALGDGSGGGSGSSTADGADSRTPDSADTLVLGCDSLLELGGTALGKPADAAEAISRWQSMRGQQGVLHTGHSLIRMSGGAIVGRCDRLASTQVFFGEPSDAEIVDYVSTGEPLEVAGAFTIDGLGGWFVDRINGDHHNVVGISLPLLRAMLHEIDLSLADLPRRVVLLRAQ
jgi:septum formation protein